MKKAMMILFFGVSSQCFAAAPSLNDAFAKALKSSDNDQKNQQVVLNVSPTQIEKATFKRDNTVHVVTVEDNMMTDRTTSAFDEPTFKPAKQNTSDDVATLQSELKDF